MLTIATRNSHTAAFSLVKRYSAKGLRVIEQSLMAELRVQQLFSPGPRGAPAPAPVGLPAKFQQLNLMHLKAQQFKVAGQGCGVAKFLWKSCLQLEGNSWLRPAPQSPSGGCEALPMVLPLDQQLRCRKLAEP